ncbi:hypothetical protein SCLCIDRAFT_61526, partial [Scleroderma citrinum Foug A]
SKKRIIFRWWPRNLNGKPLGLFWKVHGKRAPNRIANWGATLYDFYRVDPSPGVNPGQVAETIRRVASGSLIAAAMREIGEDAAVDELEWADREPDPRELPVMDTQKLIEAHEPVSSPFHPSHYPAPWPFIPFANPDPPILLQKRLPFHLLPETLYVHDPYDLLSM